jgi:hypothetical protein
VPNCPKCGEELVTGSKRCWNPGCDYKVPEPKQGDGTGSSSTSPSSLVPAKAIPSKKNATIRSVLGVTIAISAVGILSFVVLRPWTNLKKAKDAPPGQSISQPARDPITNLSQVVVETNRLHIPQGNQNPLLGQTKTNFQKSNRLDSNNFTLGTISSPDAYETAFRQLTNQLRSRAVDDKRFGGTNNWLTDGSRLICWGNEPFDARRSLFRTKTIPFPTNFSGAPTLLYSLGLPFRNSPGVTTSIVASNEFTLTVFFPAPSMRKTAQVTWIAFGQLPLSENHIYIREKAEQERRMIFRAGGGLNREMTRDAYKLSFSKSEIDIVCLKQAIHTALTNHAFACYEPVFDDDNRFQTHVRSGYNTLLPRERAYEDVVIAGRISEKDERYKVYLEIEGEYRPRERDLSSGENIPRETLDRFPDSIVRSIHIAPASAVTA